MPEPSAKRSRRPDSAQMWDDDDRGKRRKGPPGGGRHRSRSPVDSRDGRDGGSRRGGRNARSDSRDRPTRRKDDRTRSRSPRGDAREPTRRRSPPRGPRAPPPAAATAPNGTHGKPAAGSKAPELPHSAGRTQPSSREWTRRVTSRIAVKREGDENGMDVDGEEDGDPDAAEMERMMGFSSFSSTHNTKVPGNDKNYAVRKEKKTEYRQYMNRQGGFNRPLSPG
ncbi:u4 tri-snrnp-associated protein [Neofusicoccum parvum]|nr:u4 tri-snrnp-associated protein [Neofusicoccum parvum]